MSSGIGAGAAIVLAGAAFFDLAMAGGGNSAPVTATFNDVRHCPAAAQAPAPAKSLTQTTVASKTAPVAKPAC